MEAKLSRKILAMFIAVGALFFFAGLAFMFGWVQIQTTNPTGMFFFNIFTIGVGLLLIISQGWYVIAPPTLLNISKDSISFGTGLRYKQCTIPIRFFKSVEVTGVGVSIYFTPDPDIPSSAVTSAGVGYFNNCLSVSKLYMDKDPGVIVEYLESIKKF